MNFDVKTDKVDDGTHVISLTGEVDLYTAPEFKQQLLDVIGEAQGRRRGLFRDDVHRLDDARRPRGGVKRLRAQDGRLSLVCSDRNITKIFEITGSTASSRSTRPATRRSPRPALQATRRGARAARAVRRLLAGLVLGGRLRHGRPAEGGDAFQGKKLFLTEGKCGQCHTMKDAGARGWGPNLDHAFRAPRREGFKERDPEHRPRPDPYPTEESGMPANLVEGQDATDVAATLRDAPHDRQGQGRLGVAAGGVTGLYVSLGCQGCRPARRIVLERPDVQGVVRLSTHKLADGHDRQSRRAVPARFDHRLRQADRPGLPAWRHERRRQEGPGLRGRRQAARRLHREESLNVRHGLRRCPVAGGYCRLALGLRPARPGGRRRRA